MLLEMTVANFRSIREPVTLSAQLIVATHVLAMLDPREVRRDQVWFTEKTRRGETRLMPLVGYKPRNDASIDQDYLRGRYGGIPSLGNIAELFQSAPSTREAREMGKVATRLKNEREAARQNRA